MVDGPFGAIPPIEVEAASTPDDEFESYLSSALGLGLPGLHIARNRAYAAGKGRYIRPDAVVSAPGTNSVLLVADAKRRKRLSRHDIDTMARYRRVLRAQRAAIFCLPSTRVSHAVASHAWRRRIEIVRAGAETSSVASSGVKGDAILAPRALIPLSVFDDAVLPVLRENLARAWSRDRLANSDAARALLLLRSQAETVLQECGCSLADPLPNQDAIDQFWTLGPELALPEWWLAEDRHPFTRFRIVPSIGTDFDECQHVLALEIQRFLLIVYNSLEHSSDELVELANDNLGNHVFSRFSTLMLLRSGWRESFTWESYIKPTSVFQQRLVHILQDLLTASYEGEPATVSVMVVDEPSTQLLRWTPHIQDGLAFLATAKMSRRLSDGHATFFVFGVGGEFLGLFDVDTLRSLLGTAKTGQAIWSVTEHHTLRFMLEGTTRAEFTSGQWRYIDLARVRRLLIATEPSLNDANARLWEVALRLSELRRGALLMIVQSPQDLIDKGLVEPSNINIPGLTRIDSALAAEPNEQDEMWSLDNPVAGRVRLEPKALLLEQLRGKTVRQLPRDLLVQLASIDGAAIFDRAGTILGFGVILKAPPQIAIPQFEGARHTAAFLGSQAGVAIAISADGPISVFSAGTRIIRN